LLPALTIKADSLMKMAQKVDIIRVALVREYGGFWTDFDMILLQPLDDIFIELAEHDFVAIRQANGTNQNVPNHFFGAPPHSPFIEDFWRQLEAARESGLHKTRWTALGRDITTPLCLESNLYNVYYLDAAKTTPILSSNWKQFLSKDAQVKENFLTQWFNPNSKQHIVMLYNNYMKVPLKSLSAEQIIMDETLLSATFRRALKME